MARNMNRITNFHLFLVLHASYMYAWAYWELIPAHTKKREPFPSHANKLETFVTHLCFSIFIIMSLLMLLPFHAMWEISFLLISFLFPSSFVAVISITYHSFLKGMIWRWWYKYTEGKGKRQHWYYACKNKFHRDISHPSGNAFSPSHSFILT